MADLQQMLHADGGLAVQAAGSCSRQIVLLFSRVLNSVEFLQAILGSKEKYNIMFYSVQIRRFRR